MAGRTDMAIESMELDFKYDFQRVIEGMDFRKLTVDDKLSDKIKKGSGIYYNIDNVDYKNKADEATKLLALTIKDCFKDLKIGNRIDILVCGLGNDFVTPDALGPLVINKIEVNRHLDDNNGFVISAMCPGVMGQTGMESSEIIKAIVDDFKPSLVIVVDALACSDPKRMCHSIQLSTAGINPGSGGGVRIVTLNGINEPVLSLLESCIFSLICQRKLTIFLEGHSCPTSLCIMKYEVISHARIQYQWRRSRGCKGRSNSLK